MLLPESSPPPSADRPRRDWSAGEELANSLSHAAGCVAALVLAPFLIALAGHHGGARELIGASLFALTAAFLYFCSAMHHWHPTGPLKDRFERLDHAAITLLIAGTYSPFALGALWGHGGITILAIVWPLAIAGALVNCLRGVPPLYFTTTLYVGMGWFMFAFLKPMSEHVPLTGLLLILAGGLAYTGGLAFYFARRLPFHHLAWHLSVVAGTALHYVAIWRFAF